MDISPIVTDEDHQAALLEIERLWGADPQTPEGRKLDVLATLVDAYENRRFPVPAGNPIETLKLHMEMTGRTQQDLSSLLGSTSLTSELLARRHALTIEIAYKLHREWGLPAATLIEPYELAS